jgi:hypothetical protein
MKLADWPGGFEYPGVSEQIPARMAQLELTEDAALVATDEVGNPRVLIAADDALLDCRYLGETGPGLEIVVLPWEAVPLPWIAFAWFGTPDDATMTFRLGLDPNLDATYHEPADQDAAREFYASVLQHRRR